MGNSMVYVFDILIILLVSKCLYGAKDAQMQNAETVRNSNNVTSLDMELVQEENISTTKSKSQLYYFESKISSTSLSNQLRNY